MYVLSFLFLRTKRNLFAFSNMIFQMGHLRYLAVVLVEVLLVTTLMLLFLSAANLGGRSLDMLARSNCSQIREEVTDNNATSSSRINTTMPANEGAYADLAQLLHRVAMDDKTVIITSVNEAWAAPNSLLDLFRESFKVGEQTQHLLNHTIIVAVDPNAFDYCKSVHPYCYFLQVKNMNLSSENRFMSKGYVELVWSKLMLQQHILELGYNFLFTDVDIMWFRNPFRQINVFADITTSSDRFFGDPDLLRNSPNTGFYYVKSTERNVEMLKYWRGARARFPSSHEQTVFDKIKYELVSNLQVKIQFLDPAHFGGFCEYGKDLNKICTMHANCCIGLENKLHDLRNVVADWKHYAALTPQEKRRGNFTWRIPGECRRSLKRS